MRPLPPLSIFEALLQVYPTGAKQATSQWGLLPLHLVVDLRGTNDNNNNQKTSHAVKSSGSRNNTRDKPLADSDMTATSETLTPSSDASCSSSSSSSGKQDHDNDNGHDPCLSSLGSVSSTASLLDHHHPGQDYMWDDAALVVEQQYQQQRPTNHCRVVSLLLDLHPEALTQQEQFHGMLPLHIAASSCPCQQDGRVSPKTAQILQVLMRGAPETLAARDFSGDSPLMITQRCKQQQQQQQIASRGFSLGTTPLQLPQQQQQQRIVSLLPDWKWNPILYPALALGRNHEDSDQHQHHDSLPGHISNNSKAVSSLLVASLDDLYNLSASSASSASLESSSSEDSSFWKRLGGKDLDPHAIVLSRTLSSTSSSSRVASPTSDNGKFCMKGDYDDDDDSLQHELQQLGSHEANLRRELEESSRLHCCNSIPMSDNTQELLIQEKESPECFLVDSKTTKCTEGSIVLSSCTGGATTGHELGHLSALESNLRHDLESTKLHTSFMGHSLDDTPLNARSDRSLDVFNSKNKPTCTREENAGKTVQAESHDADNAFQIAKKENPKSLPVDYIPSMIVSMKYHSEGAPSLDNTPIETGASQTSKDIAVSCLETAACPDYAIANATTFDIEQLDEALPVQRFSTTPARSSLLSSTVPAPAIAYPEYDVWDDIPLPSVATSPQTTDVMDSCQFEGYIVEKHLWQPKGKPEIARSSSWETDFFVARENFPSTYRGLPSIQEVQSFRDHDGAPLFTEGGDETCMLETPTKVDIKAEMESACEADNYRNLASWDHDVHPTVGDSDFEDLVVNPLAAGVELAEDCDVVIRWERISTTTKSRFVESYASSHEGQGSGGTLLLDAAMDKNAVTIPPSPSRPQLECYITWKRVRRATIESWDTEHTAIRDTEHTAIIGRPCEYEVIHQRSEDKEVPHAFLSLRKCASHDGADLDANAAAHVETSPHQDSWCRAPAFNDSRQGKIIRCSSQGNLTQLTEQLQRLQVENRSQNQELERLKRLLSIICEIKGFNANDVRKTLSEACDKNEANRKGAASVKSSASNVESFGGDLHQEFEGKNAKGPTEVNPACPSTPNLSPTQIIMTNDKIEDWLGSSQADGSLSCTPNALGKPEGCTSAVAEEKLGSSYLDYSLNELLTESDHGTQDDSGIAIAANAVNTSPKGEENQSLIIELEIDVIGQEKMPKDIERMEQQLQQQQLHMCGQIEGSITATHSQTYLQEASSVQHKEHATEYRVMAFNGRRWQHVENIPTSAHDVKPRIEPCESDNEQNQQLLPWLDPSAAVGTGSSAKETGKVAFTHNPSSKQIQEDGADELAKDTRRQRLRELVQSRKSQRPFLNAEEVVKKLFLNLHNSNKIYHLDVLDRTDVWKKTAHPHHNTDFALPREEYLPPVVIFDSRQPRALDTHKVYVVSGAMVDAGNEFRHYESSTDASDEGSVLTSLATDEGRNGRKIATPKARYNPEEEEEEEASYDAVSCQSEHKPPLPTGSCCTDLKDLWDSIAATDVALAFVERRAEEAHNLWCLMLRCEATGPDVDEESVASTDFTWREHENLFSCSPSLGEDRQFLNKRQTWLAFMGLLDQHLVDIEKTLAGLSACNNTFSRGEHAERGDDASVEVTIVGVVDARGAPIRGYTPPNEHYRRPSSSVGGSSVTDFSIRRSGWL
jgi:hypothetical protein